MLFGVVERGVCLDDATTYTMWKVVLAEMMVFKVENDV